MQRDRCTILITLIVVSIASSTSQLDQTEVSTSTTQHQIGSSTQPGASKSKPPNFENALDFVMNFVLHMITGGWDDSLRDDTSQAFLTLADEFLNLLNAVFKGCPGFTHNSIKINSFKPGSIIANYSVSFNSVTVSKDTGVIVDYIATSVAASLSSSEINGSSLNPGDMATVATNQLAALQADPCAFFTDSICDPCYRCADNGNDNSVTCQYLCPIGSRRCIVTDDSLEIIQTECICMDNYLEVGDGCVDENLVIGLSVGIVGAALLGLIIAVIILGIKLHKKDSVKQGRISPS